MEKSELEGLGVAVQPGSVLLGKYRVDRVIGVGGMGAVVGAHHLQLDERVAIKFLLPEMIKHDEIVQRFLREARAAIKIRSEHCVRVFDVGRLENGAPYMVMEFLEGQDLGEVGAAGSRQLPIADVVDWVLQASEALAEAHAIGIVHRDLKPANLFLTRRADGTPCVKVLDFGISKQAASGADAGVTKTQAVLGSPRYMSPEQMRSTKDVDPRSDIWALGAVVYELVAGVPPFDGETVTALFAAILQDDPKPLGAWRPDVSPALEAAVRGCLEKDRNRRYASIAHFASALAPFGSPTARASAERIGRVLGVRAPAPPIAPTVLQQEGQGYSQSRVTGSPAMAATTNRAVATSPQAVTSAAVPLKSSPVMVVVAAAATLLVIAGVVGLVAFRHPRDPGPSTAASPPATATAGQGTIAAVAPAALGAPPPSASVPTVAIAPPLVPPEPPSTPPAANSATAAGPAAHAAPRSGISGKPGAPARTTPSPTTSGAPAPKQTPNNNSNPFGEDRKG